MHPLAVRLGGILLAASFPLSSLEAKEPWQLGHGPFTTAADVREHSRLGQDLAEIRAAIAGEKPDWSSALALYAFGKNFKAHAVGGFADNYNGRLGAYLPNASKHFGNPSYQNAFLFSALASTGRFARTPDDVRRAAIDAGLTAVAINWCRYELGEFERKANKMNPPNWALTNGSPKNWNEIFAFYYGPEGRHAAFEAIGKIDGGSEINDRLLTALAEGQEELVKEKWPPDAARKVAAALDAGSIALLRDALKKGESAADGELALAQARAAGFWLAASETVAASDSEKLKAVEAALSGKPDRDAFKAALGVLEGFGRER